MIKNPVCGLTPLIRQGSRVLILGSFPSLLSLEKGEYYANPRNNFWTIIERILTIPACLPYEERIDALLDHRIGLWDVFCSCERTASADATIQNPVPNDIRSLLREYPSVRIIFLNGRAAEKGFISFFPDVSVPYHYLPSSSPAHAVTFEKKISQWMRVAEALE